MRYAICLLFVLFFIGCNNDNNYPLQNNEVLQFHKEGNDDYLYRTPCVNNDFPSRSMINDPMMSMSWTECEHQGDQTITSLEGGRLWAAYNTWIDSSLRYHACGEDIPSSTPPIRNFTKLSGSNPSMKWDFMWSHYYIIKRKINNGPWTTIYIDTLTDLSGQAQQIRNNPPDTVFTDTGINVKNIIGYVYYTIYSQLGDNSNYMSAGRTLVWPDIPVIDNIED